LSSESSGCHMGSGIFLHHSALDEIESLGNKTLILRPMRWFRTDPLDPPQDSGTVLEVVISGLVVPVSS
jgi:hypothetical protein